MRDKSFWFIATLMFVLGVTLQKVVGLNLDHLLSFTNVGTGVDYDTFLRVCVMCSITVVLAVIARS